MSDQLIFTAKGDVFKTFAAAKMAFSGKGLSSKEYKVISHDGGYVIAVSDYEVEAVTETEAKILDAEDTGYKWIRISPAYGSDLKKVPVTVNGAVIRCSRNIDIPLPDSYISVLEHSVEIQHRSVDDIDDDEIEEFTKVPRFPFVILRSATKLEFNEMMSKGKESKGKKK